MKECFIRHQWRRLRPVFGSTLILLALLGLDVERGGTGLAASHVTAIVECNVKTGAVSPLLFGVNTACWDEQLFPGTFEDWPLTFDQIAINRLKQAGIRFLRYPGGRDCDDYIWNSPKNSVLRMDTDEFMVLCRLTGAVPSITVNYTASPSLAAEWVRYANVEKGYAVPHWEVGDEEYFLVDATAYTNRFLEFARAMKAVDPSIKVGANISPSRLDWSRKVLQKAGSEIDFVVHNWYPQGPKKEDDRSLLKTPRQLQNDIALIRGLLKMETPDRAAKIEIQIGGYNSVSYAPGPQTVSMVNALWAADTLGTMASSGVAAAGYWALHNVYPPRGGDYGMMTSTPENRPYPVFYVFQLFKEHFGSTLVKTTVDDERISVYASTDRKADEDRLHVIVVNKAPNDVETLLNLVGVRPEMWGEVWRLADEGGPRRQQDLIVAGGKGRLKIPAHTVTAITFYDPHSARPNPSNLARGKAVSVSSIAEVDGMFRPESAVDGRMDTRWASRIWEKVPEWFRIDLGATEEVEKIVLHWELEAVKFKVSLSQDGKNWRTVAEVTSSVGHGPEVVTFPASKARFVKLDLMERPEKTGTQHGHSLWTPWAFSLWEVEVYGLWQK